MKQIIIILFLIIRGSSAYSQNDSAIKIFNEVDYNKLQLDANYSNSPTDRVYIDGEDRVRIIINKQSNKISLRKIIKDTNFRKLEDYDLGTGVLIKEGQSFSMAPYGRSREYDNKGNMVKEIDWDMNFDFSIDNLIKKMKNEYQVDILNRYLIGVSRSFRNSYDIPYYEVNVRHPQGGEQGIYYFIDGKNGNTITVLHWQSDENSEKQIDQAFREYKKIRPE